MLQRDQLLSPKAKIAEEKTIASSAVLDELRSTSRQLKKSTKLSKSDKNNNKSTELRQNKATPKESTEQSRHSSVNPVYDDVYEPTSKDCDDEVKGRSGGVKRTEVYSYASAAHVSSLKFHSHNTTLSEHTIDEYDEESYSYTASNTHCINESSETVTTFSVAECSTGIYENYAESYVKPIN